MCPACESSKQRPHSGAYSFKCVECCCRLVLSTRPDKRLAASMLAAIERFPDNPGRERILECVKQTLTKHPSANQNAGSQSGRDGYE